MVFAKVYQQPVACDCDEATLIARNQFGEYVRFASADDAQAPVPMQVNDVLMAYLQARVRIPEQFAEIRNLIAAIY